mgnify:CR=1 FL=1
MLAYVIHVFILCLLGTYLNNICIAIIYPVPTYIFYTLEVVGF